MGDGFEGRKAGDRKMDYNANAVRLVRPPEEGNDRGDGKEGNKG